MVTGEGPTLGLAKGIFHGVSEGKARRQGLHQAQATWAPTILSWGRETRLAGSTHL